jgi:O2-independent ubiquinone biosynthesis protein UbiV
MATMKLALGPIPYLWPRHRVHAFYERVAGWPVDIVYVGETICPKRRDLSFEDWLAVAEQLTASGKEVVLSTLVLLEAGSELGALERICSNGRFCVEANDMSAVQLLSGRGPFVAGPHINAYNGETLALLANCGARRWVLPVELSGATLADLQAQRPAGLETEVLAFGRLPLAFSARCFTARALNLPKDHCDFRCADYPGGVPMETQEGEMLFTMNGIQLLSTAPCNLLGAVSSLASLDVDVLRIAPQPDGTEEAVSAFRAVLGGYLDAAAAEEMLAPFAPTGWCNGYWHGEEGMAWTAW